MALVQPVRSERNPRLKAVRAVRSGRDREHLLLEGVRLLAEALASGARVDWVLHEEGTVEDGILELLGAAAAAGAEAVPCEAHLLEAVSELDSPCGVLGFGPRPVQDLEPLVADCARERGLLLVGCGVQDPGNVGALARVGAGLGASGLIALEGSASPWHPRALRGASGTTFRIPVADRVAPDALVRACHAAGVAVWATAAAGEDLHAVRREQPVALLLGEEGRGLDAGLVAASARVLGIPLRRDVESLNVATAAAVFAWVLGGAE